MVKRRKFGILDVNPAGVEKARRGFLQEGFVSWPGQIGQVRPLPKTKGTHSPRPAGLIAVKALCPASSTVLVPPLQPPPPPLLPPPRLPLFPPAGRRGRPPDCSLGFPAAIRWCVGERRGPPRGRFRRWPVRRARRPPRLARLRLLACVHARVVYVCDRDDFGAV